MELHATRNEDGTQTLAVQGAPASSVIELRFQNTMNGLVYVETVEADGSGGAKVTNPPMNFAQNFAIVARINNQLFPFMVANDSSHKVLRFVEPAKVPATTTPAAATPNR